MKMFSLAAMALVVALSAPSAQAQQLKSNQSGGDQQISIINQLRATSGDQRLNCTGGAGHMTCTSKVAWVCPTGWSACTASPGGTCCTQN